MVRALHWFRNDLRLADNPARAAARTASDERVSAVVRLPADAMTRWGFPRHGAHRRAFRERAIQGLERRLAEQGEALVVLDGPPAAAIAGAARSLGAERVLCETIGAPEERAEVDALRDAGFLVDDVWQSSLLDPADLPFAIADLPEVFTAFRTAVERSGVAPRPTRDVSVRGIGGSLPAPDGPPNGHWGDGSEAAALAHLERYFASTAPQSYKATRNRLSGTDFSSRLSPWLAVGALSPRTVFERLQLHEREFGANESTYWIWFELLWRDFFRFWTLKHGVRLFRGRGLGRLPPPAHNPDAFSRWCTGRTGQPFVDAGLRELAATGWLSNRLRQVVASYLVHDLGCDWRAGAAWFESQLIDHDVYSNHGNWLYIAGRGADPRQGRRFDPDKQAREHDPDGAYRARWLGSARPV